MKKELSEKGKATRDRIYEAAIHIVAKRGIENASVTLIAKEAKVSRGLVIYYIPDTSELLQTIIATIAEKAYQQFNENESEKLKSHSRYKKIPLRVFNRIEQNFNFFSHHPEYFQCFMLFYYRCTYDTKYRAINTGFYQNAILALTEPGLKYNAAEIYISMFAYIQKLFFINANEPRLSPTHVNQIKEEMYQSIYSKFL